MSLRIESSNLARAKAISGAAVMRMLERPPVRGDLYPCVECNSSDALRASRTRPGAKCFSCTKSFTSLDLVMLVRNVNLTAAVQFILGENGVGTATFASHYHPASYRPDRSNGRSVSSVSVTAPSLDDRMRAALEDVRAEGGVTAPPSAIWAAVLEDAQCGPLMREKMVRRMIDPERAWAEGYLFSIESDAERRELLARLAESFLPAELHFAGFSRLPWSPSVPIMGIVTWFRGSPMNIRWRALDNRRDDKYRSLAGISCGVPFNSDALFEDADLELEITEGELDALVLMQKGHRAVGIPGATPSTAVQQFVTAHVRRAKSITLWSDNDPAGERAALATAARWAIAHGVAWVQQHVEIACAVGDAKDVTDLAMLGLIT